MKIILILHCTVVCQSLQVCFGFKGKQITAILQNGDYPKWKDANAQIYHIISSISLLPDSFVLVCCCLAVSLTHIDYI